MLNLGLQVASAEAAELALMPLGCAAAATAAAGRSCPGPGAQLCLVPVQKVAFSEGSHLCQRLLMSQSRTLKTQACPLLCLQIVIELQVAASKESALPRLHAMLCTNEPGLEDRHVLASACREESCRCPPLSLSF